MRRALPRQTPPSPPTHTHTHTHTHTEAGLVSSTLLVAFDGVIAMGLGNNPVTNAESWVEKYGRKPNVISEFPSISADGTFCVTEHKNYNVTFWHKSAGEIGSLQIGDGIGFASATEASFFFPKRRRVELRARGNFPPRGCAGFYLCRRVFISTAFAQTGCCSRTLSQTRHPQLAMATRPSPRKARCSGNMAARQHGSNK